MRVRKDPIRPRYRPGRLMLVGRRLVLLPRPPLPPYSRRITARTVYGALALGEGPAPADLAAALVRFPRPRHVARAGRLAAALARRGMVPEEMAPQGPH